ncbi:MAG TPA: glutathione S-transferase family protein [Geminicoccaceae bacterium]|jgi:glutathione S-transferase|nr:glutathione S-transferase family protein [Geminicoccaceae bacterium]
MKLYMHPVSMTSRPVRLMIAEHGLDVDEQMVDLMAGEHYQPPFVAINPNRLVPVLEDGDFRLTESSAILKYLADKFDLPVYPKDLKQRAKVNEIMDWFNTNFYRDYGYGWIYPQLFPHHRRPSEDVQKATVAWGKERAEGWLKVLNDYWLGPDKKYLCGDQITIADYFGISLLTLGEVIGCDFSKYPNVQRWLGNMKKLPSWPRINEALYGFAEAVKGQPFVRL